jgi:hypothetical protein
MSEAHSISLSNAQRRVLAAMGIDVWVRRGVPATPVAAIVPPKIVRSESPAVVFDRRIEAVAPAPKAPPAAALLDPSASTELRLTLDCVAAPGVLALGEFADASDRRLAQDIVLAIAGMTAASQRAQFRWPQTQTGDSTPTAARNAYRAFLRGQCERADAKLVLLLGRAAESLLESEATIGDIEILRFPDTRALRADPLAKKRLWLSVSRHVRA